MFLNIANAINIITTLNQLIKEFVPAKNEKELNKIDAKFQELIGEVRVEFNAIAKKFNRVRILASIAVVISCLSLIGIIVVVLKG